jgi:hypothetical protein
VDEAAIVVSGSGAVAMILLGSLFSRHAGLDPASTFPLLCRKEKVDPGSSPG